MNTKERVEEILKKKTEDVTQEEIDFVYANIDFQSIVNKAMENINNSIEVEIDTDTIKNSIKE